MAISFGSVIWLMDYHNDYLAIKMLNFNISLPEPSLLTYVKTGGTESEQHFEFKVPKFALHVWNLCESIQRIHRAAAHFENIELDAYRRLVNRHEQNDNEQDRILYIMKEITESYFKTKLMKQDRKKKKARAILDIFEVFNTVMGDSIRTIYEYYRSYVTEDHNTDEQNLDCLREQMNRIENVRKYANIELLKISKKYKQVVPLIRNDGYTRSYHWNYLKGEMLKMDGNELQGVFQMRYDSNPGEDNAKMITKFPNLLDKKYFVEMPDHDDLKIMGHYRYAYRIARRHRRF